MVTLSPRDSKSVAKEAAAMPLPKEDTTPPVIKIYFVAIKSDKVERHIIPKKTLYLKKTLRKTKLVAIC
jgi:hypothetical protein